MHILMYMHVFVLNIIFIYIYIYRNIECFTKTTPFSILCTDPNH